MSNINKLNTKFSTEVTMSVTKLVCRVWKIVRHKYNGVSDFDYHITDLRSQYPNELVYKNAVGVLPFYCKTNEVDDDFEKVTSIKLGDCNIRYQFDKQVKHSDSSVEENVDYLYGDPRVGMIRDLITQTKVRHNEPKSLRVLNFKREETNVVKLHSK